MEDKSLCAQKIKFSAEELRKKQRKEDAAVAKARWNAEITNKLRHPRFCLFSRRGRRVKRHKIVRGGGNWRLTSTENAAFVKLAAYP